MDDKAKGAYVERIVFLLSDKANLHVDHVSTPGEQKKIG